MYGPISILTRRKWKGSLAINPGPFRVLGIDPGSNVTGWGVVDSARTFKPVDYGAIKLPKNRPLAERLATLYKEVRKIVAASDANQAAVEGVFMSKNWLSALKLGEARGAILAALADEGMEVFEYSPAEVKKTVTGYGRADKEQVREMVLVLLGLKDRMVLDTSDALAVAITHSMLRSK